LEIKERKMRGDDVSYIRTYSGGRFWPLDPHPDDLEIEDIAHALSNLCRWTGHSEKFYSVAQHCVLVSANLPSHPQLEGLMHDASEAYLSDLSRPVKHAPGLGEVYRQAEKKIEEAIAMKFDLPKDTSPEIKMVDNRLLYTEARDLMKNLTWSSDSAKQNETEEPNYLAITIEPWSPERAKQEFLQRFYLLSSPQQFTTGQYARMIGLRRGAALARLQKLEDRGIVERCLVHQNQGGVVRKNVVGWRFVQTGNLVIGTNLSDKSGRSGVDTEEDSTVAQSVATGSSRGGRRAVVRSGRGRSGRAEVSGEEVD
jgi:uncharacterized protein